MTAAEPPRQLVLDLPHRPADKAEDFLVSRCNASAIALVDSWPNWSLWAAVIVGPAGSGKSHLGAVWQTRSQAARVRARDISEGEVDRLAAAQALIVENLEDGIGDERALFHLLNLAREHRLSILLTSRLQPGDLSIPLPDLSSRLKALPVVAIEPPDEALLGSLLVKLFADRQLAVDPSVVSYLTLRMERSFEAARTIVATLDRLALATRRKVSRPLAAEALASLETSLESGEG